MKSTRVCVCVCVCVCMRMNENSVLGIIPTVRMYIYHSLFS